MDRLFRILVVPMLLAASVAAYAAPGQVEWKRESGHWVAESVHEMPIHPDGRVAVRDFEGSIKVAGDDVEIATVVVVYRSPEGVDRKKAESWHEDRYPEIEASSKRLAISMERKLFRLRNKGDFALELIVPRSVELSAAISGGRVQIAGMRNRVDVATSGGSVEVVDVQGEVEASTSGGYVKVKDVVGRVDVATSGGTLTFENIEGDVEGRTSGGSIKVQKVKGDLHVGTSGGRVELGEVTEGEVVVSTSGGSIRADLLDVAFAALHTSGGGIRIHNTVSSSTIELGTSGGSIHAKNTEGELEIKSSGGTIRVDGHRGAIEADNATGDVDLFDVQGRVEARTGNGDVLLDYRGPLEEWEGIRVDIGNGDADLTLPGDIRATVDARVDHLFGSRSDIRSDFDLKRSSRGGDNRLEGELNGGGMAVDVSVGNGRLTIRKR